QSTNEELQSANEELETSKEEMQSLNEELQTVNAELQSKVEELSRANDDMKNLLNSTDIATLFLDSDLNIKRYTEQARRVIRLIPSDIGRPIGDLVSRVQYDRLSEDAAEVLRTLVLREIEVQGEGDAWYLMRVLPYRTTENVIDGLVITFVDITTVKSEQRLSSTLHSAAITVFGQDRALRYEWAYGPAFGRTTTTELVGRTDAELFTAADASALRSVKADVLERGRSVDTQLTLGVAGTRRRHALHLQPLRADDGAIAGLIGVAIDLEVYTARAVESAG
ncbi:MAG: PAS domain-containing protein, partial [Myxococcales bacterium]|nr:PAS domain-containing protein [Myxococcales bacterium]